MEDTDERLEDEDLDEREPEPKDLEEGAPDADGNGDGDGDVESIEEILVKKGEDEDESDDESMLNVRRDERAEALSVKVVPPQSTEFVCARCRLVKHRSQVANRSKMLCRDCA